MFQPKSRPRVLVSVLQCLSLTCALSFSSEAIAFAGAGNHKSEAKQAVSPARRLVEQIVKAYGGIERLKESKKEESRSHAVISSSSGLSSAENSYECDQTEHDGKARFEMSMLGTPLVYGYDGKIVWQKFGDWVSPAASSMKDLLLDELKHGLFILPDLLESETKVELAPKETVQGKLCDGLKVTIPSGETTLLFADPVSHLVLRTDFEGTDQELGVTKTQSIEYSDYRAVEGTMAPFHDVRSSGNRKKADTKITHLETRVQVDDSVFAMPPESEIAWTKGGSVTVPFQFSSNEILIKARINDGPEQRFIVDTGATQSVLDKATASKLETNKSTFNVTAGSKAVPLQFTKMEKLTIGDITLNNIPALITDLSPMGTGAAGLIGANVLRRFLVSIDFINNKLTLADPKNVTIPEHASVVPTKGIFGGSALLVQAQIDDKPPTNFLVDTGAAFSNLPQALAKPIYGGGVLPVGTIFAIDGHPMKIGSLKVKSLKLGEYKLPGVVFTVTPETSSSAISGLFTATTMGILGNPVWSQFKTTIDYRNDRLILEEQPDEEEYLRLLGELERVTTDFLRSRNQNGALASYEKLLKEAQDKHIQAIEALAMAHVSDCFVQKFKTDRDDKTFENALAGYEKASRIALVSGNTNVEGQVLSMWGLGLLEGRRNPAELVEAQRMLVKGMVKAPTDPDISAALGMTLLKIGKRAEAEPLLDRTLVLDPSNWQALWAKYKLYQEDKKTKEAALIVEQLQHYYPSFPEVLDLRNER